MREIKFKIWNGKKMVFPDDYPFSPFCIKTDGKISRYEDDMGETYLNECGENVVALQSTGLKDKNGKDIYEGDIVKFKINNKDMVDDVFFYKGAFVVIDYSHACEKLYDLKRKNIGDVDVVIIGNIYENPELLEGER